MAVSNTPHSVLYAVESHVARIVMNRPTKGNAFNPEMILAMQEAFRRAVQDADVRAILLTGAGKYFCTGMDLSSSNQDSLNQGGKDSQIGSAGFIDLCNQIRDCPKPVVAAINGPVMGGGNGLLFCCDIRLAPPNAWFQFSEVKRGLVPAMISTFIVPQLGLFHSRELFITGRRLPAARALQIGFLTDLAPTGQFRTQKLKGTSHSPTSLSPPLPCACFLLSDILCAHLIVASPVCAEAELPQLVEQYLEELRTSAPGAMRVCKELVAYVHSHNHKENVEEAKQRFWQAMQGPEAKFGLQAFYKKQRPDWGQLQSRL